MRRWLFTFLALAGIGGLQAAPEPTPQGMVVNQEKPAPLVQPHAKVERSPSERPTPTPRDDDRIWSALVCATNVADPKDPPPELREFAGRMKRVFGYNQFELTGSASNVIDDDGESWLVPSKSFWLGVRARRATSKEARGGFLLNLQLYHDQRQLVETEARLAPGSPLFIRGPQYGKGQLIIVLLVQH